MPNPEKSNGEKILERLDDMVDEVADKVKDKLREEAEDIEKEITSRWQWVRRYLAENNTVENVVIVISTVIVTELLHAATGRKLLLPMIRGMIGG